MKLAFCLFNYFPYGGLQRDFFRIASKCAEQGHEIHVYTMRFEGKRPAHFHIHELPVRYGQSHTQCKAFIKKLAYHLQQAHDLVIGFNKMPGLDIYFAADDCYAATRGHTWFSRLLPRYRTFYALEKTVFKKNSPTHILFISKRTQSMYQATYGLANERYTLLPPGIDSHYRTLPSKQDVAVNLRKTLGIPLKTTVLLMVASSFKTKGLDRAMRAMASLSADMKSNVRLYVIGNDRPSRFKRLANHLAIASQIEYVGATEDVASWMLAADLLLHPAYHECAGLVLLEALAAGLPVLTTTECGYAHYILEAHAGRVVSTPFQQKELNQLLAHLLASNQQLTLYSKSGANFAKTINLYDLPIAAVKIIEQQ